MSVSLEQIDELRKRANVSYEIAKETLEKFDGNVLEALLYLEKENKIKTCESSGFFAMVKSLIKKANSTRFVIKKKDSIILSLSVTITIIITAIAPYVVIPGALLAVITGHKIKFEGKNFENIDNINDALDKFSVAVDKAKKKLVEDDQVSTGN